MSGKANLTAGFLIFQTGMAL